MKEFLGKAVAAAAGSATIIALVLAIVFHYQPRVDDLKEERARLGQENSELREATFDLRQELESLSTSTGGVEASRELTRCRQDLRKCLDGSSVAVPAGRQIDSVSEREVLGEETFNGVRFKFFGCAQGGGHVACRFEVLNEGASLRELKVFDGNSTVLSVEGANVTIANKVDLGPFSSGYGVEYDIPREVPTALAVYFPDQGQKGKKVLHLQLSGYIEDRFTLEFRGGTVR